MKMRVAVVLAGAVCAALETLSFAQIADAPDGNVAGIPANYTESKVGTYTLPDPLMMTDGTKVASADMWEKQRRPEIVKIFEENQYGRAPGRPADMTFDVWEKDVPAFEGKAIRKQVTIHLTKDPNGRKIELLEYLPAGAKGPVPMFLEISFAANNLTVTNDPGVKVGEKWDLKAKKRVPAVSIKAVATTKPGAATRPSFATNVMTLIDAGFGFATFNYCDVEPDAPNGFDDSIRAAYAKDGEKSLAPDEWGSIGAWAWGISRAVDYLETDTSVDAKRVAIFGVSRLGKTVMWAGASDPRIAMVIASCSGEGGAALSRRNYGETVAHLTAPGRYPYQFAGNYAKFAGHADQAPMDANLLVSLIAPRPVLLQTGDTDHWSDPKGEFLSAVSAGPVYELLGKQGLGTTEMPKSDESIMHDIGYHMHIGGHGTIPADWPVYVEFMKQHLKP